MSKVVDFLFAAYIVVVTMGIAVGTIWTAYESHIANIGVTAWAQQMREIAHPPEGEKNNSTVPPPPVNQHSL